MQCILSTSARLGTLLSSARELSLWMNGKVLARSDRARVLQKGQVVLAGRSGEVSASAALASYLGV